MKATAREIKEKVDKLLSCLDKDNQHIQESLSQLNTLRSYVIKRDDSGLSKLLKTIQSETSIYRNHELKRKSIRKELAGSFGCSIEQMTLSALEESLPEVKKDRITRMKNKLRSLSAELKKEYMSTALLLSECARFNNMLLKGNFDLGKAGSVYYNSNGETRRQTDTALVNLQF